jgi:hypothetical protein
MMFTLSRALQSGSGHPTVLTPEHRQLSFNIVRLVITMRLR